MPTLEWIGKDKVISHHLDVPFHLLDRRYTFTAGQEGGPAQESGNKIIQRDNLLALKALLPQYEGRVKCIYMEMTILELIKLTIAKRLPYRGVQKFLGVCIIY
ncbi:MAG: hypothetical protein ACOX6O_04895 [Christensenellales bacterium]|jgi:adenine-specific DNA-methyltransferase